MDTLIDSNPRGEAIAREAGATEARLNATLARAAAQLATLQGEIEGARNLLERARDGVRRCIGAIVPPIDARDRGLLDDAIVSLQSEDIVDQLLNHAHHRVASLAQLLHPQPSALGAPDFHAALADRLDRVDRSLDLLARRRHPVELQPVASSGLELF